MADKDTRSRKWQLTINNPSEYGWVHERIKDTVAELKSVLYWCMCDEVGESGTYHTHIYFAFNNACRFSTLKKAFPTAHFEMAKGTSCDNRDYITKEGKWANDKKHETNISETFEEFGNMPIERQGARNDIADLYDMIKQGLSNYEILEQNPEYMLKIEKIDKARQVVYEQKYREIFREMDVTYIYGDAGSGKTRDVLEKYDYGNVFRVTDYKHPFDSYRNQEVIAFEEFRSSLQIQEMLNYLDGYPLELPCRFQNKQACYTKVYIITNIPLDAQYRSVQTEWKETWNAFLRRIHHVKSYCCDGIHEYTLQQYLEQKTGFVKVTDAEMEQIL